MHQHKLGQNVEVAALGLGCLGMSQSYGKADESESIATLHAALDAGVTHLDTADMYGPFTNERLIGKAISNRRDEVFLATKFGNEFQEDGTFIRVNGEPGYVRACCDASLQRLGVDYIDLWYQHRVDRTVPVEETWGAMSELVAAGKVRYLGISEASEDSMRRAHAVHPMIATQNEYSLLTRDIEDSLIPTARELGIALVAYSPLAHGALSGAITASTNFEPDDDRNELPRFVGDNLQKNLDIVANFTKLAVGKGVTPSQLALAWVLAQGNDVVAIPGTKRRSYLADNVGAVSIELSEADLAAIEKAVPKGSAAGERLDAGSMANVNA